MTRCVLCLLALLGLVLTLGTSVEGGRVKREDNSRSWLADLFGFGSSDDDNDNDQNELDGEDDAPEAAPEIDDDDGGGGGDDDDDVDDDRDDDDEENVSGEMDPNSGKVQLVNNQDLDYNPADGATTKTFDNEQPPPTTTESTTTNPPMDTNRTTTSADSSTSENPECKNANDLTTYCQVSDDFISYMNYNTTADAMAIKLFSPAVIDQLMRYCSPGDWCLGNDFIDAFAANMDNIFKGPLCSDGLMQCIDLMLFKRSGCEDMIWLSTFDDSLSLVCEMNGLPELTAECFGHTIATLHVTLADKIRGTDHNLNYGEEFCLGSYVGMTRKFMCTLEKCPAHEQLFRDYEPWRWFMDDAPVIKDVCKLESVCGDSEAIEEASTTTTTTTQYSDDDNAASTKAYTQMASPLYTKQPDNTETEQEVTNTGNDKPIFIIQTSDESTRFLIGVITACLVAFLGVIVLICAVRKNMRRKIRLLSKDGYAKLPTDERP